MRIDISTIDKSTLQKIQDSEDYQLKIPLVLYTTDNEKEVQLNSIDIVFKKNKKQVAVISGIIKDKEDKVHDPAKLEENKRNVFYIETASIKKELLEEYLPDDNLDTKEPSLNFSFICNFYSPKQGEIKIDFHCRALLIPAEDNDYRLDFKEIRRSARVPLFYNLLLILFILGVLHLWNGQNAQVFNQHPFFSPTYIAPILSAIALYLGIQFNELRKVSSKLSATRDFMRSTEFYLDSDTVRLFNNRYTSIILTALFAVGSYFLLWQFFPITIGAPDTLQLFAKGEENYLPVASGKVYWKDLDNVKVSVNKEAKQLEEEAFFDIAQIPEINFPISSLIWQSKLKENEFQLDEYFENCDQKPFKISDAKQRCEESGSDAENCYCRVLQYLKTGSVSGCMVELLENNTFTDRRRNPKDMQNMPLEILKKLFNNLDADPDNSILTKSTYDFDKTGGALGKELERMEVDENRPFKVTTTVLEELINQSFFKLLSEYDGNKDANNKRKVKTLNTIWDFYLYFDHERLADRLAGANQAKFNFIEQSKRLLQEVADNKEFLGSGEFAQGFVQFLLLYRSRLEIEQKPAVDSLINNYIISKSPSVLRKRFDKFINAFELVESKFDTSLYNNVIKHNLGKIALDKFKNTKEQKEKIDFTIRVSKALVLEKLENHEFYKNQIHEKIVSAAETNKEIDIPYIYLKALGFHGISLTQKQIDYFEAQICDKWGFVPNYSQAIRDRNGTPHESLIELAKYWDGSEFRQKCENLKSTEENLDENDNSEPEN